MKKIITFLISLIVFTAATYPVIAQNATEEADVIRERVKQKLEEALNNPKAYIGSVTDKTGNGLQIKNGGGEILQVSTDEITSYAKTGKGSSVIKFSDIAIGDFVVAMGYVNANQVLEAKRILQAEPLEEVNRGSILATVAVDGRNEISVVDNNQTEYAVSPGSNLSVTFSKDGQEKSTNFSVIEEDDKLIIVGEINGNSIDARRIHILPLSESPSPTATE